jgi:hypothetical protein
VIIEVFRWCLSYKSEVEFIQTLWCTYLCETSGKRENDALNAADAWCKKMRVQKKFHAAMFREQSNVAEDLGFRCIDVANESMKYIIPQLLTGCFSCALVNRQNRVCSLASMLPFDLSASFSAGAICA